MSRILVWDFPTRAFHWLLALSFAGAFLTAESEKFRDLHVMLGYTMLGLIGFRLVWGLVGTRYARFSSFAFGPRAVLDYLRSLLSLRPHHYLGHNPAGSWAIWLLLSLGLLSGASGYAVYDDLGGELFEELHEGSSNLMLAVVAVHVAGVIASSLLHGENLVKAMVSGYKSGESAQGIRRIHLLVGLGVVAAVLGFWVRMV
jgi:cytochrome b